MSNDNFILSLWEKEKMDELKELAIIEDARQRAKEEFKEAKKEVDEAKKELKHKLQEEFNQGILENQREIVANMHKDGLSLDLISKYVGLSISEIEKLIREI